MTESHASVQTLNEVLEGTPFLADHGFLVSSCALGTCELTIPFRPQLERPGGLVSGMTLMGAADVAMWLAIMTLRGTVETWVTTDMKTAFLKSARQEDLKCRARVLKAGRRTMYGVAECTSLSSGLLAHHVLTYARVASA